MSKVIRPSIYLDSHASTRVDQDVLASMLPYFTEHYANGNHQAAWKANRAVEEARIEIASFIQARPSEITFTSGATESINLGILGLAKANTTRRKQIITQRTEHSAVLACMEVLRRKGYWITILDVDANGRIDLHDLEAAISEQTLLVAIMLANNEIGTVQDVKSIGAICRKAGAKFFCDLTQGIGWHPVDVDAMNIDLAALSAHKIYGPKGVGALFVRRKRERVRFHPLMVGGQQEAGLRAGTLNVPGIVGFGAAIALLQEHGATIFEHIRALRDRLQAQFFASIPAVKLNGCPDNRHPANLNVAIPQVSGELLMGALPELILSTGSACTSGHAKPSHVIEALGVEEWVLKNTFRIGISRYNTIEEIDLAAAAISEKVHQLQEQGRVW